MSVWPLGMDKFWRLKPGCLYFEASTSCFKPLPCYLFRMFCLQNMSQLMFLSKSDYTPVCCGLSFNFFFREKKQNC